MVEILVEPDATATNASFLAEILARIRLVEFAVALTNIPGASEMVAVIDRAFRHTFGSRGLGRCRKRLRSYGNWNRAHAGVPDVIPLEEGSGRKEIHQHRERGRDRGPPPEY